jgi:hypothetical protein
MICNILFTSSFNMHNISSPNFTLRFLSRDRRFFVAVTFLASKRFCSRSSSFCNLRRLLFSLSLNGCKEEEPNRRWSTFSRVFDGASSPNIGSFFLSSVCLCSEVQRFFCVSHVFVLRASMLSCRRASSFQTIDFLRDLEVIDWRIAHACGGLAGEKRTNIYIKSLPVSLPSISLSTNFP